MKLNKLILITFICCSLFSPTIASMPFDRIPIDKYAHCFLFAYITKYAQSKAMPTTQIVLADTVLAFGKEYYDKYVGKEEIDITDLSADFTGMLIGLVIN